MLNRFCTAASLAMSHKNCLDFVKYSIASLQNLSSESICDWFEAAGGNARVCLNYNRQGRQSPDEWLSDLQTELSMLSTSELMVSVCHPACGISHYSLLYVQQT